MRPSLGILVASSQALDQYVVRHPEFFGNASPETARIAPDQLLILLDHIRCAAFELPFASGDRFGGAVADDFLEVLAESGVLHREGERWDWIADSYPAQAVSLHSVADGNFVVVDRTDGRQTIIAEVDYSSAALTLYEGAIYMFQPRRAYSAAYAGAWRATTAGASVRSSARSARVNGVVAEMMYFANPSAGAFSIASMCASTISSTSTRR